MSLGAILNRYIGEGKFYRSASPDKWKESFSKKEVDIMNQIMGDTLEITVLGLTAFGVLALVRARRQSS